MSPHRVDFSRNAEVFDQRHGSAISSEILQALMEASGLPHSASDPRPCLASLEAWTAERFGLDDVLPFPREIEWKVYRREATAPRNLSIPTRSHPRLSDE